MNRNNRTHKSEFHNENYKKTAENKRRRLQRERYKSKKTKATKRAVPKPKKSKESLSDAMMFLIDDGSSYNYLKPQRRINKKKKTKKIEDEYVNDKKKKDPNDQLRIKFTSTPFMNLNLSSLMSDMLGRSLQKKKKQEEESEDKDSEDIYKYDPKKKYEEQDYKIKTINDLITLGKTYKKELAKTYPIDMYKLHKLIGPLEELNGVVGMEDVKKSVVNNIIYFLQDLDDEKNMMHTVITGPPGVGKTMLGHILAKLYYNMGILKRSSKKFVNPLTGEKENFKFTIARRSDLVGRYLGETAIKTQEVINNALGGILFIDEAYSLGNPEKRDSFSKECIDTINQNLTEKKGQLIVMIAGYEQELETCLFSHNPGLRRRFMFKYKIDKYDHKELADIFLGKIKKSTWQLEDESEEYINEIYEFFKENYKMFTNYGGDMELLLFSCKISHSLRIFGKNHNIRKKINLEDIKLGLDIFKRHKNNKKSEEASHFGMMYS